MDKDRQKEYQNLAKRLKHLAESEKTPSRCAGRLREAGEAIEQLLLNQGDRHDPIGKCPFDLVCRHLNQARRVAVAAVDAFMEKPDPEEQVFDMMFFGDLLNG